MKNHDFFVISRLKVPLTQEEKLDFVPKTRLVGLDLLLNLLVPLLGLGIIVLSSSSSTASAHYLKRKRTW